MGQFLDSTEPLAMTYFKQEMLDNSSSWHATVRLHGTLTDGCSLPQHERGDL